VIAKRVAIDTGVLIWSRRDAETEKQREMRRQCRLLMTALNDIGAQIVLSTVGLAEFLAGIPQDKHSAVLRALADRFEFVPFDANASAIAAHLWNVARGLPKHEQLERRVLKADVLIIATAKIAGANQFFTLEPRCRKLASKIMASPALPTHDENLFREHEAGEEE